MGNYLEVDRSDEANDDAVALVEGQISVPTDETSQTTKASATVNSNEHRNASLVLEPDPNKTLATTTISDLPTKLLAAVVGQFEIRQWKQLELVNRQFRAAVLMAWSDLRSLNLATVFGNDVGTMRTSGQEALREQETLRKFLDTLLVRSPLIEAYKGQFYFRSEFSSLAVQRICRFEKLKRLHLYRLEHSSDDVALLNLVIDASFLFNTVRQTASGRDEELSEVLRMALSQMTLQELIYRSTSLDKGRCLLRMNCDEMVKLDLAGSEIDLDVLNQLLPRCEKLTHLDLSSTQRHLVPLPENNFFTWLRTAKTLKSLKLNFFIEHADSSYDSIWYAELRRSLVDLGSFETLKELDMSDFRFCTDDMIDAIIDRLANCLKKLSFDIKNCTESALLKLAGRMVNLEVLQLWCSKNALFYDDECNSVSDKVVSAISTNLSKLTYLDLSHPSASANTLELLLQLKNLRHLAVVGVFDDKTLITVASAFGHQLLTLRIPKSDRISDDGILAAAPHLRKLRYLELTDTKISDKSLTALSHCCSELRTLALIECPYISSRGIQSVIDSCQNLETLEIRHSPVNLSDLKKCDRIWRKYQQVCECETLCSRFIYPSPYYCKCSSSRRYWYWCYCQDW